MEDAKALTNSEATVVPGLWQEGMRYIFIEPHGVPFRRVLVGVVRKGLDESERPVLIVGIAKCSDSDNFNKATGIAKAEGWARQYLTIGENESLKHRIVCIPYPEGEKKGKQIRETLTQMGAYRTGPSTQADEQQVYRVEKQLKKLYRNLKQNLRVLNEVVGGAVLCLPKETQRKVFQSRMEFPYTY